MSEALIFICAAALGLVSMLLANAAGVKSSKSGTQSAEFFIASLLSMVLAISLAAWGI